MVNGECIHKPKLRRKKMLVECPNKGKACAIKEDAASLNYENEWELKFANSNPTLSAARLTINWQP